MTAPPREPIFFGRPERPCFGWLHRAGSAGDAGVVVCNPFGYEAVCSHRSLRHFAESFARAGLATLRFDYDGTGDSAGDDRDPERLAAWVESTREAVRTLRATTGVKRVWLMGVRLGVTIAALAASGGNPVDVAGLVAVAPVVSGRAYLRELGLLQMALGLGEPPPGAAKLEEGAQEALGFVITSSTKESIAKADLTKLDAFVTGDEQPFEVLVLDRDDLPSADKWTAHLVEQGVPTTARKVPGYVEMMLDPHKVVSPKAMIGAATEWLSERRKSGAVVEAPRDVVHAQASIDGILEKPVHVDEARRMFGILTAPTGKASGRGIVLLNAGAIHRIGANRLYVTLARRWAAIGHHVLRLDITGIGDSPERNGEPENIVYHPYAVDDVKAAVEFLRSLGLADIRAVGLCAGAYHAFKAASADRNITGFVAINPLVYGERPTGDVMFPVARVSAEAQRYQKSFFELEKWKKLLRGDVNLRILGGIVSRYTRSRVTARARDLSRRLGRPWKHDFIAELDGLTRRKIDQRFIFANDDPGQQLLQEQGANALQDLQRRGALAIEVIDGPDHTFTQLWSHEPLMTILTTAISRPLSARA